MKFIFTQGTLQSIFFKFFFSLCIILRHRYFLTKNILSISFPNTFKDDCTDEIFFIYIDYALLKSLNCNAYVRSVAFDSTYLLASGSRDNTVKIWDKNSSNQLRSLTGHSDEVYAVAFDSNHMLASGSNDKTIKLWNKNSGENSYRPW